LSRNAEALSFMILVDRRRIGDNRQRRHKLRK
jgi:hypothetical protein